MKIIQQISLCLFAALVGIVHLSHSLPANGYPYAIGTHHADSGSHHFSVQKQAFCSVFDSRHSSHLFQINSKLPVQAQPSHFPHKIGFPDVEYLSGLFYYHLSSLVLTGLEVSDIIFPFHSFW